MTARIEVVFPLALPRAFSYESAKPIPPGVRVRVSFGKSTRVGLVVASHDMADSDNGADKPTYKPIEAVLDSAPLVGTASFNLAAFLQGYYHYWPGGVWEHLLPKRFWAGKPMPKQTTQPDDDNSTEPPQSLPTLNAEQQKAVDSIDMADSDNARAHLLYGVTGSGKTEVYMALAEAALAAGRSVLILVPEIGLLPQNRARFATLAARLNASLCEYHSAMTPVQRERVWWAVQNKEVAGAEGTKEDINATDNTQKTARAHLVIGTRSAVFLPMARLGLIVVDEEHDTAYKQMDRMRYSARDVAVWRGHTERIPVVLGSATPSCESLHNAKTDKYSVLRLTKRAANAALPEVAFLDMRGLRGHLHPDLLHAIKTRLAKGEQTMLFLNKRGYAPVLCCMACRHIEKNANCDCGRNLTLHAAANQLRCHVCGYSKPAPAACSKCGAREFKPMGAGTERIEELLSTALAADVPTARIARMDRDTMQKKGAFQATVDAMRAGDIDILLGTQMISKGHDFPNVTLVGIVEADQSLFSERLRAGEHLLQLMSQVAGRAGRGAARGQVLIQSAHPDHETFAAWKAGGYETAIEGVLAEREMVAMPPYGHHALFRVDAFSVEAARAFAERAHNLWAPYANDALIVYPVHAPFYARIGKRCYQQCLIYARERRHLHALFQATIPTLQAMPRPYGVRWGLDVDPIETG